MDDDYVGDEIVRGGILLTETDSASLAAINQQAAFHGVTGDTDDDTYNDHSLKTIDDRSNSLAQLMYQGGVSQSEVMMGQHLLRASMPRDSSGRNEYVSDQSRETLQLPSAPHTLDDVRQANTLTPTKNGASTVSEHNDSSQSQRIAQIR